MKILFGLLLLSSQAFAREVVIKVSQTANRPGNLFVAVFNDAGKFPDKTPFQTMIIPTQSAPEIKVMLDLPDGDYAVSMFLDENKNGKLDTNFLGIPKERFGFSRNPRILTGAPSYQDCEINVSPETSVFDIRLNKLF